MIRLLALAVTAALDLTPETRGGWDEAMVV